jgi:hypothetical protein
MKGTCDETGGTNGEPSLNGEPAGRLPVHRRLMETGLSW